MLYKDKFNNKLQTIRSFVYSLCIFFVLLVLINIQLIEDYDFFDEIAVLGLLIGILEGYFTFKYLNFQNKKIHIKNKSFWHLLNHTYYPLSTFLSLTFFSLVQKNLVLSYTLVIISFLMYWAYFYYLPMHLHFYHFEINKEHKVHTKIDFVMHLFKFYSYFIANLTISTYYFYSKIGFDLLMYSNILLNFLFLLFHVLRKNILNRLNVLMALIFALITSFFTLTINSPNANLFASKSTLFYYLASALYYHKLDGTFNHKILIEYGSIATIASILLFSVK